MRTASCCGIILLALIASPLQADPSAGATENFIESLNAVADVGPAAVPDSTDLATDRGGVHVRATCIASCGGGTTVSCSYTPPSTCVAVDRNCPSQQGYVSCNGVTTYCQPACTALCTEGAIRNVFTGSCCDNDTKEKEQQQCIGGVWVPTGVYICVGHCGPLIP